MAFENVDMSKAERTEILRAIGFDRLEADG